MVLSRNNSQKENRQKPGSVGKIRAIADESLRRFHRKMLKTDGLAQYGLTYINEEGEAEYNQRYFSI